MVLEAVDMANYNGPATIVTLRGEIEVIVDLRSGADPDDGLIWAGQVDRDGRGELDRAMYEMSPYGLVIRLPDGREGNFMPSAVSCAGEGDSGGVVATARAKRQLQPVSGDGRGKGCASWNAGPRSGM
jgi:hypothetical protein